MEKPPAVLQAWGYNSPENIGNVQRLLGMPDWYTPGIDDYDKTRAIIAQLLQGQPIVQQPGPPGSPPPGPPQPSIPIDPFEDNAQLVVQVIQSWAQKNWRLKDSNPNGYANVIAYGKAYQQIANQPPPAPPLPPPDLKLTGDITKMDPATATAVLGDYRVNVPPPPVPMQLAPGQIPPPQAPVPQQPGQTIQ